MCILGSNDWIGIALYALAILRKHLFCTTKSLFSADLSFPLAPREECHTTDPYVIEG